MFRRLELKALLLAILVTLLLQAVVMAERHWGADVRPAGLIAVLGLVLLRRRLNNHALDAEIDRLSASDARSYRNTNVAVRLILFAAILVTGLQMFLDPARGWAVGGVDSILIAFAVADLALVGAVALCLHSARLVERA